MEQFVYILTGMLIAILITCFIPITWVWIQNLQGLILIKIGQRIIDKSGAIAQKLAQITKEINDLKQSNGTGTN